MKTIIIVAFASLLIAFFQNSNNSNDTYNESLRISKSSLFMNYVSAFDTFYQANGSANGDVTKEVTLPGWMPADDTIRMYVSSGYGYVFMPVTAGVLPEIMKATDFSSLIGISDNSIIKTNSGTISKPSFIPAGYIVYVR